MSEHIILNGERIGRITRRLAHQIMEEVFGEKEAVLAGIFPNGSILAGRLKKLAEERVRTRFLQIEIRLDKQNPGESPIILEGLRGEDLKNKTVILVDDVMNSGKTGAFAISELLKYKIKKIKTAVLVERNHKDFPIKADYVGYSLSTNLHDHVEVILDEEDDRAVLI